MRTGTISYVLSKFFFAPSCACTSPGKEPPLFTNVGTFQANELQILALFRIRLPAERRRHPRIKLTFVCFGGFGFWGSGFRVWGLEFRVQGLGFRVQGAGFRVQGLGSRV